MSRLLLVALVASCELGVVEDDAYWDETRPDDDSDVTSSAAGAPKNVSIAAGTLDHAELVELLPIARSESGASRRVVLRLGPADLPGLAKGDRLITPAEVQVTTRCDIGQSAPGCNYNPNVRAQLILTGSAGDTSAAGNSKVIATQSQSCDKSAHHCMFVFRPADASAVLGELPCMTNNSCYVNLVMWAWHPDAPSGDQDKVLVGGNDGDYLLNGKVEGDVSRLMAVRERNIGAADRASREATGGGGKSINTNANPELIYSLRLKQGPLQVGEKFLVEANIVTDVGSRVRFSTQMFLTKNPNATDGTRLDSMAPGSIGEQNGFNCTDTCTTHKVAVFEIKEAIADDVYVNVVAKSAVPGGGSTRVTVNRNDGWLRAVRYRN